MGYHQRARAKIAEFPENPLLKEKKKAFSHMRKIEKSDIIIEPQYAQEANQKKKRKRRKRKYNSFPIPGIEPGALRALLKAEYVLVSVSGCTFECDECYLQPLHYNGFGL